MTHVPYRGSAPALADLLAGQVQVAFDTTAAAMEQVKAGKLRALAITTRTTAPILPDVPPVAQFVAGYEATGWYGVGAPRDTPIEIVGILNQAINAGLAEPQINERFADIGATPFATSPDEFGQFLQEETVKWAKVIEFSGTKAD
jgi:tripartite-type tricarboxylate transporter receptor subunit TctC